MFERVLAAVAPRKTLSEEQLEGHKRKRRNGEPGTNWEEDGPSSDADVDDGPWLDLEASREIALFQAAARNDVVTTQVLVRKGAIINCQDSDTLCTALHIASSFGHMDTARMLVLFGADIAIRDINGRKAADIAVENGHADVACMLSVAEDGAFD